MDSLSLLWVARAAGLQVGTDGELLIVEGPRRAEPLARQLLAQKEFILAALAAEEVAPSDRVCPECAAQDRLTLIPRHWRRCRPCVLASLPRCLLCRERPVGAGGVWCEECQLSYARKQEQHR
jgi:hypothetical protein